MTSQTTFDFISVEIANLKLKIDKLSPVVQAEAIMKYLGEGYTQRELGERLGKTRDWVAKRVQFKRAWDKLSDREREEAKSLTMEVVILLENLTPEQRKEILSKRPTVSIARLMIAEFKQGESPEAKLKVLEKQQSKSYLILERMTSEMLRDLERASRLSANSIPALKDEILEFVKANRAKTYRYGLNGVADKQLLHQRIAWLERSEEEKIKTFQQVINRFHDFYFQTLLELGNLADTVPSLKARISLLEFQLRLFELGVSSRANEFQIQFCNGVPPLQLNISGHQMDIFYRALARAFHPDKHPENKQEYNQIMKDINLWKEKIPPSGGN